MSQMPMPDDWDGESFCRFAICWPDSLLWRGILHGLVEQPQQGRFWDFATGSFLGIRESFRPAYSYNFELKEVLMACGDTGLSEVAVALENIALAISSSGGSTATATAICGDGDGTGDTRPSSSTETGVAGTIEQDSGETVPIYSTEPILEIAPGEFPEGYADLAEYRLSKCQIANGIVDGWIGTLRNFAAFGVFNYIALAGLIVLALVGAIVFPPSFVPLAAAALGVLSVNIAILSVVADEIESNREDIICWMIQSDSTEAIIALIADFIDVVIANLSVSSPIGLAIKTIALLVINGNTLNQLFKLTAHLQYPDADCSACEDDICLDCLTRFTLLEEPYETLHVQGTAYGVVGLDEGGYSTLYLAANTGNVQISFHDLSGWTAQPGGGSFQIGQGALGDIHSSDDFEAFQAAADAACISADGAGHLQWAISSITHFTVVITPSVCA